MSTDLMTLEQLADVIRAMLNKIDSYRISVSLKLREAMTRIESGEIDMSWADWYQFEFHKSKSHINELLALTDDTKPGTPEEKLAAHLAVKRERSAAYRERAASETNGRHVTADPIASEPIAQPWAPAKPDPAAMSRQRVEYAKSVIQGLMGNELTDYDAWYMDWRQT